MKFFSRNIKQQSKHNEFLLVDVGDLYLKYAFCEQEKDSLRVVLWGKEEINTIFWSHPFEKIWQKIQELYVSWKNTKPNSRHKVMLSFSSSVFKAHIATITLLRKNPNESIQKSEDEEIKDRIHKTAEEKIKKIIAEQHGIQQSDLVLENVRILSILIDGYEVPRMQGFGGSDIECKVLATFLFRERHETIKAMVSRDYLYAPQFIHEAEAIQSFSSVKKLNGIFIDIGDNTTQVTAVQNGELFFIEELKWGSDICTKILEQMLSMKENIAREFKDRYTKGELTEDLRNRVSGFFLPEFKKFAILIRGIIEDSFIASSSLFLFGGGALIPGLKEVLEEQHFGVSVLLPKDFGLFKDFDQALNPLYTPLFLEYYAKK